MNRLKKLGCASIRSGRVLSREHIFPDAQSLGNAVSDQADKINVFFFRSIEGIEIDNIQRRMFEPLKYLTHM